MSSVEPDASPSSARSDDPPARPFDRVGEFTLQRVLGWGGMGVVYLAEQASPRRLVALKLLRADAFSPDAVKRFRREAELLALVRHPGVAQVYGAGVKRTDVGELPWFAMEFVDGRKLGDFARERELDTRARIELVIAVADAVHAAHECGVVHRDLKPDNVVVDSSGRPRVLDFGVAHATDAERLMTTLHTAGDRLIGTLAYMSPEQASGERGSIDRRADVYALGAILYELLTGALPFATRGLQLHDALRAIREAEPARPSELRADLDRDLDTILGKALEKDRERRYASALALAEDLRRYLRGQPIAARPPSALYQTRRFVQRHRRLSASVVLVLGALSVGLFVSLALLQRARRAETESREERDALQRFSDLDGVSTLEAQVDSLWPSAPALLPRIDRWLADARAIVARLPLHREHLAGLADHPFQKRADLERLVATLERFAAPGGAVTIVESRREFAASLREHTVDGHADAWRRAIAEVATSPRYGGLALVPQIGLIPLGPDPGSTLQEFALYAVAGATPTRAASGELELRDHSTIVLVLIPGGTVPIGAQNDDPDAPCYDRYASGHELGVRWVTLAPYFISKYEMTQAQWERFTGENPSYWEPTSSADGGLRCHGLRNPVEHMTWSRASSVLSRLGLELPTEAQWEHAARGGTTTAWWTGAEPTTLGGAANLVHAREIGRLPDAERELYELLCDGWLRHAPVGSFRANGFGLHDVAGNVSEWCRDPYVVDYASIPLRDGDGLAVAAPDGHRAVRGGNCLEGVHTARSAFRTDGLETMVSQAFGVRPVRTLR